MTERRKDILFKALFLLVCGATGAGGSWTAIQVGQARMEVRLEAVEREQGAIRGELAAMRQTAVSREENARLDAAQDQRIADILSRLDAIQKSQDETLRLLVQLQGRR